MKRVQRWFGLFGALAAAVAVAGDPPPPTLKDLKKKPVEIRKTAPVSADAQRARDTYEQFLSLNAGDPELRAEAMRRLGDLKLEAGEYERIERELANGSPLNTRDSIRLYTALLETFGQYPRRDAVLYQLARAYEADQQPARAQATLDRLVRECPQSAYVAEAHFRSGEMHFAEKRWHDAQAAYAAVIRMGPGSEFYEQSLYKQGWSLFKQGDGEAANAAFGQLLDRLLVGEHGGAMVDVRQLSRPQQELLEDTLRVMALTYSYADGPKSIDAEIGRRGSRPYDWLLYSGLGDLYVSKERYTDAADAYRAFVQQEPNHDEAPALQERAIEAYRKGGFAGLVLDGKREFVDRYRLPGPFWTTRTVQTSPEVAARLKLHLQDLAAYYHEQAQASHQSADYQQAARWYGEFLTSFPTDEAAPRTNYLLADTLFDDRRFRDAAHEYERTAYAYPPHPQAAAAGYAALVAYEKQEPALAGEERSAWHRDGLGSAERFATTFPAHPESAAVLARTAREYYELHDYPHAIAVAELLLAHDPPADAAQLRTAWVVVANSRFETADFVAAEAAYREVQQRVPATDPTRGELDERLAASVYKQAEGRQAAGDAQGAVDDYLRVATLAPAAKIRSTADFDAAALLVQIKDWPRAIGVLEGFRRDFPASELQPQVTAKLAVAYAAAGEPARAAMEFERIAASPQQPAEAQREALTEAAGLYEQAGDVAAAARAWTTYVQRFPAPMMPAIEARAKLASLAKAAGDARARQAQLEAIVATDRGAGAERTDRSRYLAATASLELAVPARDAFDAIHLVAPLKKSLEAKKAAMQQALRAYAAANDYAVAEVSTAATFETAELYRRLGQDVLHSERPAGLNAEELEQYDTLLEEQAFPFEEKAIALHEVNLDRTREQVYDVWVKRSLDALTLLNPGKYGKSEQGEDFVTTAEDEGVAAGLRHAAGLAASKDYAGAEEEFFALRAQAPESAAAPLDLGILYARQGRWADAERVLDEAVRLDPRAAGAHAELGIVYRSLGRLDEATRAYEQALDIAPDSARVHRNFGILLDAYRHLPADAVAHYERALELGRPDDRALSGWLAEARSHSAVQAKSGSDPT